MTRRDSPFELFDELRIIAQNGLEYADDPYDRERYERVLALVSEWYGETVGLSPETVRDRLKSELGHVTPKVSADAAIADADGDLLLQRRADDGRWCLPGGYVDPGESPAETAVREAREETGLTVTAGDLLTVYNRGPAAAGNPHGLVGHVYHCTVTGGSLECSREGIELAYRTPQHVDDWHTNHETLATEAHSAIAPERR